MLNIYSSIQWKKTAELAGNVLVFVSIFFIFNIFWKNRYSFDVLIKVDHLALNVLVSTLFYMVAVLCAALSWRAIFNSLSEQSISFSLAFNIYGRSLLSKYIPGNFFQYVQRGILCFTNGLDKNNVIWSIIIELLLVIFTALSISVIGFKWLEWQSLKLIIAKSFLILIIFYMLFFLVKWARRNKLNTVIHITTKVWLLSIMLYMFYFILSGLSFLWILTNFNYVVNIASIIYAIYFFALAFAAGMIIPGAPAGIGIREGMIILVFSPYIGSAQSAIVAMLLRLSTVLGDTIFMMAGSAFYKLLAPNRGINFKG